MTAKKKIYDVRWEDRDGEQGYYVRMTKVEADKVRRFLTAAEAADTIKDSKVDAIEGEWLLSPRQLIAEFKERYTS